MAKEQPGSADERKDATAGQEGAHIDFRRYAMNPVEIVESKETARATPRRIGLYVAVLIFVLAAAAGLVAWNRIAAQRPPIESLDPEERARAKELVDNILTRIESLQGYVYDVQYASVNLLRIFINPTVLEKSGAERRVTDDEVLRATKRVVQEFRGYATKHAKLFVEAYVVNHPGDAAKQHPVAMGEYDPETDSIKAQLTPQIPTPGERPTGTVAPPGEGHIGAHGGAGPGEGPGAAGP
jgi:hypothetical protein